MIRTVFAIFAFVVLTATLFVVLAVLNVVRLPGRGAVSMLYSKIMCRLIGIRVRVVGKPVQSQPALIVANHVSWSDIFVITSVAPTIFVAKQEVASWPLVGLVAKVRGTVFVDRSRRSQTAVANAQIARFLSEHQSIVLFAEGTSGDGNHVLPFRSALIGGVNAAVAQAKQGQPIYVQPMSICYTGLQGLPMGRQHRSVVAWYGDLDLVPHLRELVRRGAIDAVVTWGEPIRYDAETDRKAMVRQLESQVRELTALTLRGRSGQRPSVEQRPAA